MVTNKRSRRRERKNQLIFEKHIHDIVLRIRSQLEEKYNVYDPTSKYFQYSGLCDTAYVMLVDEISKFNKVNKTNHSVKFFHGEQAHTYLLDPKFWCYQHT